MPELARIIHERGCNFPAARSNPCILQMPQQYMQAQASGSEAINLSNTLLTFS